MTDQAIEKINTEMQKDPDNMYIEIIGHYIIDRCADEQAALAVINDKKSLNGALSAVSSAAQKKKKGNCGVLKDREIFDAIDSYFGFTQDEKARAESIREVDGDRPSASAKTAPAIKLDFDSFF